jgi:chromosome transmission fidelity protein 1
MPDKDGRVVLCHTSKADKNSSVSGGVKAMRSPEVSSQWENGRILPSIKFVLLNPSGQFKHIIDNAKSVLLLGGTMKPFSYLRSFLFPNISPERIRYFSCDHVVPRENVRAVIASAGPNGVPFDFRHHNRNDNRLLDELKMSIKSICKVTPNGIVLFFTSYNYMGAVLDYWHRSCNGYKQSNYGSINGGKVSNKETTLDALRHYLSEELGISVFIEPRDAVESERTLNDFSSAAAVTATAVATASTTVTDDQLKPSKGAILFCVMGGKMSEGINFSDHLARCVIVVGMPYPDSRDIVLREKLVHANSMGETTGKTLYEAMCMKVVNQSIGRSIRHINDYASIVLLDKRYSSQKTIEHFPSWINRSLTVAHSFASVSDSLISFFQSKSI